MAPTGVEALNKARCFLHSGRGKEVANKDVVSAKAVGAVKQKNRSVQYQRLCSQLKLDVPL